MRPSPTSGRPRRAPSAAMRRSHASATSRPPPKAKPFTAAIVGTGSAARALRTSWPERAASRPANASLPRRVNSLMSAPATKARPEPVRMSAFTASAPATTSSASPNSSIRSAFSALRTSGRSKVMVAMPSSTAKPMLSNSRSPSSWICWSSFMVQPSSVLMETGSGLAAKPAGPDELPQERMDAEFRVLELGVEAFRCRQGNVESDEVTEGERAERHVRAELHGAVDVFRGGDAFGKRVDGVVHVGDEEAVDDEAGRVPAHYRGFADRLRKGGGPRHRLFGRQLGP